MLKRLLPLAAFAVLALAVPGTSAEKVKAEKKDSAPYVHAVVLYLKADAPTGEAEALLADCHEMLAKIPTVRLLKAGRAAEKALMPAKKDFAVGLVMLFDDVEGCQAYIDHPLHKKFVEKHLMHLDTDKLGVYDFVNAKK